MDIARLFKSKARTALFQLYFTNPESSYAEIGTERIMMLRSETIKKSSLTPNAGLAKRIQSRLRMRTSL
jgi:hypothetical protein